MENHNRIGNIKNKIEHDEEILREIQNRMMIEIWSIIPISLHSFIKAIAVPHYIINVTWFD